MCTQYIAASTLKIPFADRFGTQFEPGQVVTYPVRPSHGNVQMNEGVVRGLDEDGALVLTAIRQTGYGWRYGRVVRVAALDRVTVTPHTPYGLGL
jgi:hypothetical protein